MCDNRLCPLLGDPTGYIPDTLNLNEDMDARKYWFDCFEKLVERFASRAEQSQKEDETARTRAMSFKNQYIDCLHTLKSRKMNPKAPLTVRMLLNLNESCLRSHGFSDPWENQKELENTAALSLLRNRLSTLDAFPSNIKWFELCKGLLAGNMFDWGARAISDILETNENFGLQEALQCIQPRPWLIDGLDLWLERLEGPKYKCAAIFVDNSGVDIILGVLPFARELITRQTDVILCANSEPALNDITYLELTIVLKDVAEICPIIKEAINNGNLIVMPNGQSGPCLDLRDLEEELCIMMVNKEVDLMVIEGMGRALHTNLNAKFICDSLKLAVVKNQWWATRLGGQMFSVICQFTPKNNIL